MNIDNLTEVDQNVEERFELSETESNRHQNEKLQTQDVFEVSFAFALNVCMWNKKFLFKFKDTQTSQAVEKTNICVLIKRI